MNETLQRAISIVAITSMMIVCGCNPTIMTPNQNDALRRQVRDLQEKVKSAEAKQVELEQQLAQSAKAAQEKSSIDPAILGATPQVAMVQIGDKSGFLTVKTVSEADGEAKSSALDSRCIARVYLEPSDGLGRFLQIVGSVKISIFELPVGGKSQTLGQADFSPGQVRDAWRSGMFGSHYTFEIPLEKADWHCQGSITAKLEFQDGMTDKVFPAQRELRVQK